MVNYVRGVTNNWKSVMLVLRVFFRTCFDENNVNCGVIMLVLASTSQKYIYLMLLQECGKVGAIHIFHFSWNFDVSSKAYKTNKMERYFAYECISYEYIYIYNIYIFRV